MAFVGLVWMIRRCIKRCDPGDDLQRRCHAEQDGRSLCHSRDTSVMTYAVKEIFYTLQGEGANTGRAAVFCRFAGCNLWNGREHDRGTAVCQFCDTDFVGIDGPGGGSFATAEALARAVADAWPKAEAGVPFVVCTG